MRAALVQARQVSPPLPPPAPYAHPAAAAAAAAVGRDGAAAAAAAVAAAAAAAVGGDGAPSAEELVVLQVVLEAVEPLSLNSHPRWRCWGGGLWACSLCWQTGEEEGTCGVTRCQPMERRRGHGAPQGASWGTEGDLILGWGEGEAGWHQAHQANCWRW